MSVVSLSMLSVILFSMTDGWIGLSSKLIYALWISLSLSSICVMNFILSSRDSTYILSSVVRSYSIIFKSRISKSSCNSSSLLSYFSRRLSSYRLLSSAKSKSWLRLVSASWSYNELYCKIITYQFYLSLEVLWFQIISNFHIFEVHLHILVFFELLKTICSFVCCLVHSLWKHPFKMIKFNRHLMKAIHVKSLFFLSDELLTFELFVLIPSA